MNWRAFLADRWFLLLGQAMTLALLLLVVQLAIRPGEPPLGSWDVAYLCLLVLVATAMVIALDFVRQRKLHLELRRALAAGEEKLDEVLPLRHAVSHEQRAWQAVLDAHHRRYLAALQRHGARTEQHHTFVHAWVHQMKVPLSVLDLTIQQAQVSAGRDDDSDRLWAGVREETDRMAEGLELMMQTARLERFEIDLQPASVDLEALAREVINELKWAWIRSAVFPRLLVEGAPPKVASDAKWLAVVLRQLLNNAIKYTLLQVQAQGRAGEGAREVVIALRSEADRTVLEVADNGIGIPAHDLPRIFAPFFTGDNGRLTSASTGMGLYLAAEICRRLGHVVQIDSTVGEGTVVALTFAGQAEGDGNVS